MKSKLTYLIPLLFTASTQAQEQAIWQWGTTWPAIRATIVFGLLGMVMLIVGFKTFDKLLTRIDIEGEIQRGNVAAAIIAGSALIGIGLILAAAIS